METIHIIKIKSEKNKTTTPQQPHVNTMSLGRNGGVQLSEDR